MVTFHTDYTYTTQPGTTFKTSNSQTTFQKLLGTSLYNVIFKRFFTYRSVITYKINIDLKMKPLK